MTMKPNMRSKLENAIASLRDLHGHTSVLMPQFDESLGIAISILSRVDVMEKMATAMVKDLHQIAETDTYKAS